MANLANCQCCMQFQSSELPAPQLRPWDYRLDLPPQISKTTGSAEVEVYSNFRHRDRARRRRAREPRLLAGALPLGLLANQPTDGQITAAAIARSGGRTRVRSEHKLLLDFCPNRRLSSSTSAINAATRSRSAAFCALNPPSTSVPRRTPWPPPPTRRPFAPLE
jgi:hypothetical protein